MVVMAVFGIGIVNSFEVIGQNLKWIGIVIAVGFLETTRIRLDQVKFFLALNFDIGCYIRSLEIVRFCKLKIYLEGNPSSCLEEIWN